MHAVTVDQLLVGCSPRFCRPCKTVPFLLHLQFCIANLSIQNYSKSRSIKVGGNPVSNCVNGFNAIQTNAVDTSVKQFHAFYANGKENIEQMTRTNHKEKKLLAFQPVRPECSKQADPIGLVLKVAFRIEKVYEP